MPVPGAFGQFLLRRLFFLPGVNNYLQGVVKIGIVAERMFQFNQLVRTGFAGQFFGYQNPEIVHMQQ